VRECTHGDGRTSSDGNEGPKRPRRVIVVTTPVSRDVANEACSAFNERPSRARVYVQGFRCGNIPRFGKDRRVDG